MPFDIFYGPDIKVAKYGSINETAMPRLQAVDLQVKHKTIALLLHDFLCFLLLKVW